MRDNSERLGVGHPQPTQDEPAETTSAVDFAMPTDIVDLPSKGKFYPDGHYLKGKETIEIRFMTAKHEDILTNKALLKKGLAIDRLLQSLIVDPKIKVNDLLVGDKNALVIAARISGYGEEYATKVVCPMCEYKFEHHFDLTEIKCKEVTPLMIGENNYIMLTLPRTKAQVECKLFTGNDEKALLEASEFKKKAKLSDSLLTDQLKSMIVSVNGETDKTYINKFVEAMPASDSRYLRNEYFKRVPDIDMKFAVTCPECDHEEEVDMPLGAEFFWPKR